MVNKRKFVWLYLAVLWVLISVLTWPAYVLCSTLLALHGAEGWQLDAWQLTPRPLVFERFLQDYKASAIITIPIGLIAVVDYLLLSRYKATWLLGGIFLPIAATIIAYGFYRQPHAALPALLATGILLAFVHRLIDIAAGSDSRGRLR